MNGAKLSIETFSNVAEEVNQLIAKVTKKIIRKNQ